MRRGKIKLASIGASLDQGLQERTRERKLTCLPACLPGNPPGKQPVRQDLCSLHCKQSGDRMLQAASSILLLVHHSVASPAVPTLANGSAAAPLAD